MVKWRKIEGQVLPNTWKQAGANGREGQGNRNKKKLKASLSLVVKSTISGGAPQGPQGPYEVVSAVAQAHWRIRGSTWWSSTLRQRDRWCKCTVKAKSAKTNKWMKVPTSCLVKEE